MRKVCIKMYLLNTVDGAENTASDLEHLFTVKAGEYLLDIGRTNYFNIPWESIIRPEAGFLHPPSDICLNTCKCELMGCLRIAVVLEAMHTTPKLSLEYNSKERTGMVGLSNLGATCYLNALLQVASYHNPHPHLTVTLTVTLTM